MHPFQVMQKEVAPLSKQQVFDNAWNGVILQGCKSAAGVRCLYRLRSDASTAIAACGIGHSIPDSVYDPRMETSILSLLERSVFASAHPTDELSKRLAAVHTLLGSIPSTFLSDLQACHDGVDKSYSNFIHYFKRNMTRFATEHGLIVPA